MDIAVLNSPGDICRISVRDLASRSFPLLQLPPARGTQPTVTRHWTVRQTVPVIVPRTGDRFLFVLRWSLK